MNWQFNLNYFEILKGTSDVWITKAFLFALKLRQQSRIRPGSQIAITRTSTPGIYVFTDCFGAG